MRLIGSHEAADEIFMNFASGGQQNDNDNSRDDTAARDYEDPLDDVFGSAPSSPVLHAERDDTLREAGRRDVQDPSDIPRLRSLHVTNGYREGIAASKEQHVQAGFDEGYSLGAELGMKVGWILGVLEGVVRAISPASRDHEREANEDGGIDDGRGGMVREDGVRAALVQAEDELSMKRLFAEEFFGGDGVWVYPVPGTEKEGEEDVTFKDIADAHPMVLRWEKRVRELAGRLGVEIR